MNGIIQGSLAHYNLVQHEDGEKCRVREVNRVRCYNLTAGTIEQREASEMGFAIILI